MTTDNPTRPGRTVVTQRLGVPLTVALGVVAAMLLAVAISLVLGALSSALFYRDSYYESDSAVLQSVNPLAGVAQALLTSIGTQIIPVGIGIFVTLRWITPITAGLPLLTVVIRSVIAALIGIAAAFVILSLYGIVQQFDVSGPLFGNAFPRISASGTDLIQRLFGAVASAVQLLIQVLPLTLLAGILTWIWLQRRTGHESTRDTRVHV